MSRNVYTRSLSFLLCSGHKMNVTSNACVCYIMCISLFTRKSNMVNTVSVSTMLTDRIAIKDSYRSSGNIHEQKFVDQLYQMLDDVATRSLYQVEDESTLDYDDEIDGTKVDQENDPTFYRSEDVLSGIHEKRRGLL